jgi:hypothetical protein
VDSYLIDVILVITPERNLVIFDVELRLVRTLGVQLQSTFLAGH